MVLTFLPSLIRLKSVNDAEFVFKRKNKFITSSLLPAWPIPNTWNGWVNVFLRSLTSLWQTQLALETSLYIWLVNKLEKKKYIKRTKDSHSHSHSSVYVKLFWQIVRQWTLILFITICPFCLPYSVELGVHVSTTPTPKLNLLITPFHTRISTGATLPSNDEDVDRLHNFLENKQLEDLNRHMERSSNKKFSVDSMSSPTSSWNCQYICALI